MQHELQSRLVRSILEAVVKSSMRVELQHATHNIKYISQLF